MAGERHEAVGVATGAAVDDAVLGEFLPLAAAGLMPGKTLAGQRVRE